jgi:hypothetical protein
MHGTITLSAAFRSLFRKDRCHGSDYLQFRWRNKNSFGFYVLAARGER